MQTGQSLTSITPKSDRVIRTEPVLMSDGRMHGVHVWTGPADIGAARAADPGPAEVGSDPRRGHRHPESLANSGKNPEVEVTFGRAFAEDLPSRELNPNETKVLAMAVKAEPGQTLCSTWDLTDLAGEPDPDRLRRAHRRGTGPDGRDHLVARGDELACRTQGPGASRPMTWRSGSSNGLAQAGVHRALVDLNNWTLLKWLDEPCPFYDWRGNDTDRPTGSSRRRAPDVDP